MCKDEQQIGEEQVAEGVGSFIGGQDPGIKLFGRVISALNSSENDESCESGDLSGSENEEPMYPRKEFDHSSEEAVLAEQLNEDRVSNWVADELGSSSGSYSGCEDEKTVVEISRQANPSSGSQGKPIVSGLCALEVPSEIERDQHPSTKSLEETTPRKPDKPVPCPRCDSLDTKFCYFNNYNVNQPRHFCKQCQRYWTAGGTLRNVPVGAGRRKHKHSSLQHQHQQQVPFDCFTVRRTEADSAQQLLPSSLPQMGHQSAQPFHPILPADRFLQSSPSATSTITTFKQENPCPGNNNKSSSAFQLKSTGLVSDQTMAMAQAKEAAAGAYVDSIPKLQSMHSRSTISSEVSNCNMQEETARAAKQGKCAEECQSGSSLSAFSVLDRKEEEQLPMPLPTDPSGWPKAGVADGAAGWMNAAAPYGLFNGAWPPPPYVFNPGWSAFPQSHMPASYYNPSAAAAVTAAPPAQMLLGFPWCHPSMWAPGAWSAPPVWTPTMPWEAAAAAVAAAAAAAAASAISTGNPLGKHPRDRQMLPEGRIEGPLWLPKTLRMDDQGEQVRSSILASLGLSDQASSQLNLPAKGMHKSFVSESAAASVEARHDNPAATTRSAAFQESN